MTDEIAYEISEFDIPNQLAATGPMPEPSIPTSTNRFITDIVNGAHLVGAVEGWIAGRHSDTTDVGNPDWNNFLDDEGYPARRDIRYDDDDTILLTARFGRNKKWAMAINRKDDELARKAIMDWIDKEVGRE